MERVGARELRFGGDDDDLVPLEGRACGIARIGGERLGLEIVGEYTSGNDKMQMCYAFEFLAPDPLTPARVAEVQKAFAEAAPEGGIAASFSRLSQLLRG